MSAFDSGVGGTGEITGNERLQVSHCSDLLDKGSLVSVIFVTIMHPLYSVSS